MGPGLLCPYRSPPPLFLFVVYRLVGWAVGLIDLIQLETGLLHGVQVKQNINSFQPAQKSHPAQPRQESHL